MSCVSVIIPTLNRAHLIREAVESVLGQTCCDYEILVVDDGSEDETERALNDAQTRIVYRRIQHAGASVARNVGLETARGEYVAFLDSDDVWEPRFLEKMTGALDTASHAGWAYCDYSTFDEHGMTSVAYLPPEHKINGHLFEQLLQSDFISTGALMVRRRCLQHAGGFDPRLAIAHDWDLWLRLAWRYEAAYVDEPLVRIRSHAQALSRNAAAIYAENLQVLAKLRRDLPDAMRQYRPIIRQQAARFHRALAGDFRRAGRPLLMLKHLVLMLAAYG